MFPCSSNVHNPFAYINNIRAESESNFSMTTIGHEINPINFQTLIDHHQYHYHEDGLLLSHLLSHRIEKEEKEDHSLQVVPNLLEDTKGILMKKKTKTKTKTANVPIRKTRNGKKDRHSKICTAQGLRDRRMRLSLQIARKFFHLQDMLGFDKASKTIEWLFVNSKSAIEELMKQNCKMITSSANSESRVVSAADEKEKEEEEEDEEDHGDEEKKKKRKQKLCKVVGKESREKARERARERTRQKMKIQTGGGGGGGGGLDQEMNVHSCYDSLKTVCQVEDHQPGIDELLAAADDHVHDELHVINSNCWANYEEDFPGNIWDNSNKMQCFSCTITNTDLLRFSTAAAAAGNNVVRVEEKPSNNYSIVFPNPRSDDLIHHTQQQQQQNPSFVNSITAPIFLTSTLIAQADHQQNPSSNSIWQSQFLENQYFSCNPIISNKNHIS